MPIAEPVRHRARARALSEKARAGKLTALEMQGGSFTISSLGGIGGTAFTPIINAPEVAILGVSRSDEPAGVAERAFVPRLMLPLSLSYDHRVIDGAEGARFIVHLAKVLADPRHCYEHRRGPGARSRGLQSTSAWSRSWSRAAQRWASRIR
jgi:pyruvate/2-oxoglutarate dehydrogenase complex dihydrolipoamide acyltransferase (E2) component